MDVLHPACLLHTTLALAMNTIGGKSNSGKGEHLLCKAAELGRCGNIRLRAQLSCQFQTPLLARHTH